MQLASGSSSPNSSTEPSPEFCISMSLMLVGLGVRTPSTMVSLFVTTALRGRGSGVSLSLTVSVCLLVSTSGVSLPLLRANLRRSREGAGLIGSTLWFTNPRRDGGLLNIGLPMGLDTLETGVILPLQLDTKLTAGLTTIDSSPAHLRGILNFNLLRADVGLTRPVPIVLPSGVSGITSTDLESGPSILCSTDALKHPKHILSSATFPYSPHPFWHILGPELVEFPLRCSADILSNWFRKINEISQLLLCNRRKIVKYHLCLLREKLRSPKIEIIGISFFPSVSSKNLLHFVNVHFCDIRMLVDITVHT